MLLLKQCIKAIAFHLFPHFKHYNERLSNIEVAIAAVAAGKHTSDENALNGQQNRKQIVSFILSKLHPHMIVETGTHLGHSTGYFARFCKNIFTSDSNPIYMWAAQSRLIDLDNIIFYTGDSRVFLHELSEKTCGLPNQELFFYLDAHWHEDLPLHEELKIICEGWLKSNWIILIDDFCVPDDCGYNFPSYGRNKTLNYDYLKDLVELHKLNVFYPTIQSSEETGNKSGHIFLCNGGVALEILKKTENIKEA